MTDKKIHFEEMKMIYELAFRDMEKQLFSENSPYGWTYDAFSKAMFEEVQRASLTMKIEIDENGKEKISDSRVFH